MLKLSHFLIPMVVSLAGVCYAQDLGSEPVTATPASSAQEPASVSYKDIQKQNISESAAEDESAVSEEPQAASQSQESVPVKKTVKVMRKKAYNPKNDPEYLRSAGANQHSKGVTIQMLGGSLLAAGIVVMAVNADGFGDATDNGYTVSSESDQSDSTDEALGFVIGELLAIGGVTCLVVGGVIRSMGTNKLRRADQLEEASLFDRHRVKVIPVASVERRMGGLVVAGNF